MIKIDLVGDTDKDANEVISALLGVNDEETVAVAITATRNEVYPNVFKNEDRCRKLISKLAKQRGWRMVDWYVEGNCTRRVAGDGTSTVRAFYLDGFYKFSKAYSK